MGESEEENQNNPMSAASNCCANDCLMNLTPKTIQRCRSHFRLLSTQEKRSFLRNLFEKYSDEGMSDSKLIK